MASSPTAGRSCPPRAQGWTSLARRIGLLARRLGPLALAALTLASAGCTRRRNPTDTSDPAITARVRAELKGHPTLDIRFLQVDTVSGVVTLSGMVESTEERRAIIRLVKRVPGVQQVVANLVAQE